MADRFVDFNPAAGSNTSGDGSSGSPWNTILHAISVFPDTEPWNLYCRGTGGVTEQTVTSRIDLDQGWTNNFNVYPDVGFEPTENPPTWPLRVAGTSGTSISIFRIGDGNIWEGIALHHYNTSSQTARVGSMASDGILRNAKLTCTRNISVLTSSGTNYTIENCFFDLSGGQDAMYFNQYNSDGDLKGCVFYNAPAGRTAVVIGSGGPGWQAHINGCLFYNNAADISDPANSFRGQYNATTKGTPDSSSNMTLWTTGVSTTPGVDVVDGSTGDLRAVSGGALDDGWQGGNYQNGTFSADDFVLTSRPQGTHPDIGFYEITGAPPAGVADLFGKIHHSPVYGRTVIKG